MKIHQYPVSKKLHSFGNAGTAFLVVLMIAVIGGLAACSKSKPSEVKLGAMLALTGQNALWGENARNGIELTLEKINAQGGVNKVPLKVIFEDTKGEPREAITVFNKLRDFDGVSAVMGDIMSSTTLAVAPTANSTKIPLIGIGSSAPAVTEAGPYIYRVWPSDLYEGTVSGSWAIEAGFRRGALVFINNAFGTGLKDAFKKSFSGRGGEIIAEQSFESDPKTFRDVAAKLKGASFDLIYIVGYYENTALMLKTLREAGIQSTALATSSAISPKIQEIAGAAAEGLLIAAVNDVDEEHLTSEQKVFFEEYAKRYKRSPDWAAVKAADALLILVKCLNSGATTGEQIKGKLDEIKSFAGISKEIIFDENGDVTDKPIVIRKLSNGAFVLHATPKVTH